MKAVVQDAPGGPDVLHLAEAPDPVPGSGEVLIRVRAAGVNRADLLQRMGRYPPPDGASEILGMELSGEVAALGPDTHGFAEGDRVMALVPGGAYASLSVAPAGTVLPIPDPLGWSEAAAVPEAFLTAWMNLVELGRLAAGETVLIHAGASGVGSAAVQLAREMGARVAVTAGSAEKLEFCRALGAEIVSNRHRDDFTEVVRAATGGRGVDLILDFVGVPYWERNLTALARGGRLVLIGFLGGSQGEVDLGPVMRKNLTVTGTTLRGSPPDLKAKIARDLAAFAFPRFAGERLRVPVDRAFPLAEAPAAHRYMAENRNAGKIVLTVE